MRRWLARGALLSLTLAATWLALAIHPQPLFAHQIRHHNITLFSREALPPETSVMLAEILRRISRSEVYDARHQHRVFLTGSRGLFEVMTFGAKGTGLTNPWGNAFIGPCDVRTDRVFDRAGLPKSDGRTLTYVITHELTHAMTLSRVGYWRFSRLSAFQGEGYADYVAFARPVDIAAGRAALARGDPRMNVSSSGLYARYELLVAFLLEEQGMSVNELLARPLSHERVEHQLMEAGGTRPTPP